KLVSKTYPDADIIKVYEKGVSTENMYFGLNKSRNDAGITYLLPAQRTCALIGNGGILLNSSCGEEINSNNFVVRCNIPVITGYEQDVGNKTNVTIVNRATMMQLYRMSHRRKQKQLPNFLNNYVSLNNTILWYPGVSSVPVRQRSIAYLKSRLNLVYEVAYTAQRSFIPNVKRFLHLRRLPSTGLRTMVLALSFCDVITMYGFYPRLLDTTGNKVPYHYYGSNATIDDFKAAHNWKAEFSLLESLHRDGTV
uniref:Alpha-2,8-sialyltransferase 8B-like n=1 Tax=Saccoglossus kowalevskii TaxID=10224 RepID=A0ABM0LYA6_SACKO